MNRRLNAICYRIAEAFPAMPLPLWLLERAARHRYPEMP